MREIGIQPDVILCRSEQEVPENERRKIALFTNVPVDAVISAVDVDSIYKIPSFLHKQQLDEIVLTKLQLEAPAANLTEWDNLIYKLENPSGEVNIALVGKYVDLTESYKSLSEALIHAGMHCNAKISITYVDSEEIEEKGVGVLRDMNAILVPGGFGTRGVEGKIQAIRYARENNVPYLGICLGMQLAVIEFARHVMGWKDAHSTEFASDTKHPVVALITEWMTSKGEIEKRDIDSDLGGTMRLGEQKAILKPGSKVEKIYGASSVGERHRHRYEVNGQLLDQIQSHGLAVSATSENEGLCEVVELEGHPWFVGCQFHPEFTSTPRKGHPLFNGFVAAALKNVGK